MLGIELIPELHALPTQPEWFQQDGAPVHFWWQVRDFLSTIFPDRWIGRGGPVEWAPRSPDLNPLDFSVWGILKDRVYQREVRDIGHLRQRVIEECNNFDAAVLRKIVAHMERRVNLCVNVEGGHFEHLL